MLKFSKTLYCFLIIQGYNELCLNGKHVKEAKEFHRVLANYFSPLVFRLSVLVSIAISLVIMFFFRPEKRKKN